MKTISENKHSIATKKLWQNPEYRKHMSEAHKGQKVWNKGLKGVQDWSAESRNKVSRALKGRKKPLRTPEHAKKIADAIRGRFRGKNSPTWKGGVTSINQMIRTSVEYKLWRKSVFERDGYQCIWGGKEHGSKLHADHIKKFSDYPYQYSTQQYYIRLIYQPKQT